MIKSLFKRQKLKSYLKTDNAYKRLFENYPDMLFFVNKEGIIVETSGGVVPLTGYNKKQLEGTSFQKLVHPDDLGAMEQQFKKVLKGEPTTPITCRIITKKGVVKDIEVSRMPIQLDKEEPVGIYGIATDITERKELERTVQKNEERLNTLLTYSSDIVGILDNDGTIRWQSPSFYRILGHEAGNVEGTSFFALIHEEDTDRAEEFLKEMNSQPNEAKKIELRLRHRDGRWLDFEVSAVHLPNNEAISGIVVNYYEITERKKAENEIQYMATHDFLTGLPNRRHFDDQLDLHVKLAHSHNSLLALFVIDVDDFKFANKMFGYDVSDQLLIEVGKRIKNRLRHDDLVARTGSAEFSVMLTNIQGTDGVRKKAADILQLFEEPFYISHYDIHLTISVGVSIYPKSGDDSTTLKKQAYFAVELVKKKGKNHYRIFTPEMDISTSKSFMLKNDLKSAHTKDQFFVQYQPIINAQTKQIVAAEALIRWEHPEWGTVPPDEFIMLAEESGSIFPISDWLLDTVCKQNKTWQLQGLPPIKVSVNFSVLQFLSRDVLRRVEQTLNKHELEAKWLGIEITESVMLDKKKRALEMIKQLKQLGVEVALDDFGTGYSSLSYLTKFKPHTLKLDRTFIQGIPADTDTREVVSAIVQLAKKLSIQVVAEGVETKEQQNVLSDFGCDWLQGYLYSPPLSSENFEQLLKKKYVGEEESGEAPTEERRKHFRIDFPYPLQAVMTMTELNNKKVNLGATNILVENIGPGGLRFLSTIRFPIRNDAVLKFDLTMAGEKQLLFGRLPWFTETNNLYQYGVEFIIEEEDRETLIQLLYHLQIILRKNPLPEHTPFYTDHIPSFFKLDT